eukprot:gene136-219_t
MIKDQVADAAKDAAGGLRVFASSVIDVITPTFIREIRTKKKHKTRIIEEEEFIAEVREDVGKNIDAELKDHHEAKTVIKKIKKQLRKEKAGNDVQLEAKAEAKDEELQSSFDDFRERQKQIVLTEKERKERLFREETEKVAKDTKELRTWRQNHWSAQAKILYKEAAELREINKNSEQKAANISIENTQDEWIEREVARTHFQVQSTPKLSDPILLPSSRPLGIFGIPQGNSSYESLNKDFGFNGGIGGGGEGGGGGYDGFIPGLDQHEVPIFSAPPQTDYEMDSIANIDKTAELTRTQTLYDALQLDCKRYELSMQHMYTMRSDAERDLKQVSNELKQIEREQLGPPRRLPIASEIISTNLRKEKQSLLRSRIDELQHSIDVSHTRKVEVESQMLSIAKTLSILRQEQKKLDNDINNVNNGLGMLPMVIGRNISTIDGLDETAKPLETFNAITQQSKFIVYKDMEISAQKVHRDGVKIDRKLWLARQSDSETRHDVESTINKLADISDRLQQAFIQTLKFNLIDAIQGFHKSGIKLNTVKVSYSGPLSWWLCHKSSLSTNIEPCRGSGALGAIEFDNVNSTTTHDANVDVMNVEGEVEDELMLGVSLGGYRNGVCTDSCVVRLGTDLDNLHLIGEYKNEINPDVGAVLYDVKHTIKSDRLAYKFEFHSSSDDPQKHLMVAVGQFEKYETKDLEFLEDPTGKGKQRVISSYIKMLRVEENQGKMRITKLLEELIRAEDSDEEMWSSSLIAGFNQYYQREFFLRIIRAEIILEEQAVKNNVLRNTPQDEVEDAVEDADAVDEMQASKHMATHFSEEQKEKVKLSQEEYINRKRYKYLPLINAANKDIGKRLDMYDTKLNKWRHVMVFQIYIRWIENGIVAKIFHILQEFDEENMKIGGLFPLDLKTVRYFESPPRISDDSAIARHKLNQLTLTELNSIEMKTENNILHERSKFEELKENTIKNSIENTENSLEAFEKNIDEEMNIEIQKKEIKKIIKNMAKNVLEEIKVALILPDPKMKPSKQAYEIALQRYIIENKNNKRRELQEKIDSDIENMKNKINQHEKELHIHEQKIRKQATFERKRILIKIKEQKAIEKTILLSRVKFDENVFKLAVPQGTLCEHSRTKAWGDNYNTGVRCLTCNKELTELFKEESQLLGYGTSTDPSLYEAIKRHRVDEARFKFKNPKELKMVEEERLRLEKERRVLEEENIFFYDFSDIQAIYEFDRRHAKELKDSSVFRQGVQWSISEFEDYTKKCRIAEAKRLRDAGLLTISAETFDPLETIENPPPTFRAQDERRYAQYSDLKHLMGRLSNFEKRIKQLKSKRVDLLMDRATYGEILQNLHRNTFKLEIEASKLENDLERTAQLFKAFQESEDLYKKAQEKHTLAIKRLKRAEMRCCGPWERVREIREKYDIAHDETRNLIKAKFNFDLDLEVRTNVVKAKQNSTEHSKIKFENQEQITLKLHYIKPGNMVLTKYGLCRIRFYRAQDDIIMISLNFGNPPAKAWIYVPEIVAQDRGRQQGEKYLMEVEDEYSRRIQNIEAIQMKKECYLMSREEFGMKEYYNLIDFQKYEIEKINNDVNNAINDGYTIMSTKQFHALHKVKIREEMTRRVKKHNDSIVSYIGRRKEQPLPLTMWGLRNLRKEVNLELKNKFLEDLAMKTEFKTKEILHKESDNRAVLLLLELIKENVLSEVMEEIVKAALYEGRIAKRNAEFSSGIYFPDPMWMQYGSYCLLRDMWKQRKLNLKRQIELTLSTREKFEDQLHAIDKTDKDIVKEMKLKKLKHIEKKRQRKMNLEMAAEEALCKKFYKWELKDNLRERRLMRDEEQYTKQYEKDLEKLKSMKLSKYNVSHFMLEEQEQTSGLSIFEKRRLELKTLTLERRRISEEIALMSAEDRLSDALRVIDRMERQRKQYIAEFGDIYDSDEDDDDKDENPRMKGKKVRIPPWMTVPKKWYDWSIDSQLKYVVMMEKWKFRQSNKERNIIRDLKRIHAMEKKGIENWKVLYDIECNKTWTAELSYMETEEECKETEHSLKELQENIRRMVIFCQEKGEIELRIKTELRRKEAVAKIRDKELSDANKWLEICNKRVKNRTKLKRLVEENCLWIDTDSLNGYPQRYRTDILRGYLYKFYFTKLVYCIVNRAEIIATERKMMFLQEQLSQNRTNLIIKTSSLHTLWYDYRRSEYLRMYKSALSNIYKFFPLYRKKVLQDCFAGWVRFHLWNRGHREAFELKYEVIKRHVDLERMFKNQLLPSSSPSKDKKIVEKEKLLTMQRHRERPVACKYCRNFYLEAQNHSLICKYHPGKFVMECPKTCSNPGNTPLCISHKRRRWTCCDATIQTRDGCSRRNHIPQDSDPVYEKIMEKINERDAQMLENLDERLEVATHENWSRQAVEVVKNQVFAVEDPLDELRITAKKYHNLKFE